jgi:hypothetical protein
MRDPRDPGEAAPMIRTLRFAALLALAAGASSAQTPVDYAIGGETLFRVVAPEGWRVRRGFETDAAEMDDGEIAAPRIVSVGPEAPAGLMWAGFWSPPGLSDIESPAAARFARTLAADLLEQVTLVGSRLETVNGLTVRVYSGAGLRVDETGRRDEVRFDLALAQLPAGRVAVGAFLGEEAARQAHADGLAALLASLEVPQ